MKKIIRASTIPLSLDVFCKGLLMDLSIEYEVVALSSPDSLLDYVGRREGVRTIAVPMERHISLAKDIKALLTLIRVFYLERPDMVHSMTPKAGFLCMIAGWLTGVPVRVHTFTGLVFPTSKGLKRKVLMMTDRVTCACATHVIPEGEGVKKDLLNNRITKKPMRVLGFGNVRGVDLDYYSVREEVKRKVEELGLRNENMFSFLYVGRIVGDKGINELIESFKHVSQLYPHTRLFLVGAFEDNLDPISRDARETIKTNNSILEIGQKTGTDLLAYYAASDCFVFPSYREGFPNTVLEAGAFGLPCIVTDINGSREIIKNGYNGLVVPPHSTDDLYFAMKWMIDNPKERMSMASVARDHIASHYEQSFVRKCLYDFYHEVLKDN